MGGLKKEYGDLCLGQSESLTGKRWLRKQPDLRTSATLAQKYDLPDLVASILVSRGVNESQIYSHFDPKLRNLLPDPLEFLGMEEGVSRIIQAINEGQKIAVFGDYDVDGATSSALLYHFFKKLGISIRIYIPDRVKEGYGPNNQAIDQLANEGVEVLITVDCGITAHDSILHAKSLGLDVIVIDHHVAEPKLPAAVAVINPNRLDEESQHTQLAAVGVTFIVLVGLNRELRNTNYFFIHKIEEPQLINFLDLVALGTVADVVPLTGVNRALVVQGLKVMAKRRNKGLVALGEVAGIAEAPESHHLGFIYGPRINAGGRVGEPSLGVELLTSQDSGEAHVLATKLDSYNVERQNIESEIYDECIRLTKVRSAHSFSLVIGKSWHPGVIGIVASRLKDRFNVPSFVLSLKDGIAIGSGRSISGVDIGGLVIAARQKQILLTGGGHSMAAGFKLKEKQISNFETFLNEKISAILREKDIKPTIFVDGTLTPNSASQDLVETIASLGPFGSGNPEPRFMFASLRVVHSKVVGKHHVQCSLVDLQGSQIQGISFRSLDTPIGQRLLDHANRPLHLVGRVRVNNWQGRSSIQIHIEDVAEDS